MIGLAGETPPNLMRAWCPRTERRGQKTSGFSSPSFVSGCEILNLKVHGQEALDLASALVPSHERDKFLVHAVSQWSGADPAAAVSWAMQVTDLDLSQRLVAAVAVGSAEQEGLPPLRWPPALLKLVRNRTAPWPPSFNVGRRSHQQPRLLTTHGHPMS